MSEKDDDKDRDEEERDEEESEESEEKHAHDHGDHGDLPYGEDEVHAHIGSYRAYFAVFMGLIFFTLLTVGVASIHLGKANLAVAVIIASIKAALVCTFFMHLKDDNKFNSLILISAVTFIGVFFALTLNDVSYREKLDPQSGNRMLLITGDKAPGSWENPIKHEEEGASEKKEGAPAPTTTATATAQPTPTVSATASAQPSATGAASAHTAPAGSASTHTAPAGSASAHAAPAGSVPAK